MIKHIGVRTGGGRAYVPDMGGATTSYSTWSWPTLDIAASNHRVRNSVGGITLPFRGTTYGYDGPRYIRSFYPRTSWSGDKKYCMEFREYHISECGRVFVLAGEFDILEFASAAEAEAYLEFPTPAPPRAEEHQEMWPHAPHLDCPEARRRAYGQGDGRAEVCQPAVA